MLKDVVSVIQEEDGYNALHSEIFHEVDRICVHVVAVAEGDSSIDHMFEQFVVFAANIFMTWIRTFELG